MAIEIITAEQAFRIRSRNPHARWPTRAEPGRLYPIAEPMANVAWQLSGSEKVFCIGSCFAREVENALDEIGFDVLSTTRHLPRSPNSPRSDRGASNKYNVASILNELRWAFDVGPPYAHADVLLAAPGERLLQDCQLRGVMYLDEAGASQAFREAYNAAFRRVRQADLIVLTLGLSEVWKDNATGLYLNIAPSEPLAAAYPGRFDMHVFDHAQTLSLLDEIDALLTAQLKPGYRLLITVSPVPLASTFRDRDVLVANAYSKAVLRSAVDAFVQGRPHASYFPSYEFVTLSHPNGVWCDDDFRHVNPAFVHYLMASVMAQIGGSRAPAARRQRDEARSERVAAMRLQQVPAGEATRHGAAGSLQQRWSRLVSAVRRTWRTKLRFTRPRQTFGFVERWDGRILSGWAYAPGLAEPAGVEVRIDGLQAAAAMANQERRDVAELHGVARLYSGFHIELPESPPPGAMVQVQVDGRPFKTLTAPTAG